MKCRFCDGNIDFKYFVEDELRRKQLCFGCWFWWEKVEWRANNDTFDGCRVARIHYNHYLIRPDDPTGPQGFGGREHVIKFDDGEEVITRNLWHQGEIPRRFREHLPNNATFVDTRLTCSCRKKFYPITPTQTKCLTCVIHRKPKRW